MDSVTLTVIQNALVNIAREMGTTMMRTAYSPIFNEALDFSVVIFDDAGRMLAQAEYCPSQIGSIKYTVGWTIEELGRDAFDPGDVVIHNDPYRGSGHIPEHTLIKPVFVDDELLAFVATVGHMAEIGGKTPGGFAADATEVYQEGLCVPPVKIVERGCDVESVWKIILANHRTPRNSYGDIKAMIGSVDVAERRLVEMAQLYGTDILRQAGRELMDLSERRMREEIRAIPNGSYHFEDVIEDDGVTDQMYHIRLTLTIDDDELIADWTGTDPQALGPTNCTYGSTASAVYGSLFQIADSTIPKNEGCYRPLHIIAPPGTIVNVRHPGAEVAGHTEVNPRLTFIVIGALSQALPDRVVAADGGTSSNFLFGGVHPDTGQFYANYHFEGVGWGGRPNGDGNDAQCPVHGNCRNTPVEVFETRYPWRTISYGLRPDTGGPGRFRGGLGTQRIVEVLAEEITVTVLMERMKVAPWGLFGGREGGHAGVYIKQKGEEEFQTFQEAFGTISPTKFAGIRLQRGDQVKLCSAGGGGFGDPYQRDPARVREDVRAGYVSSQAAREQYGVGLCDSEIDTAVTAQLRLEFNDKELTPISSPQAQAEKFAATLNMPRNGQWQDLDVDPLSTPTTFCALTGQLLPRRAWIDQAVGADLLFVGPQEAAIYEHYWLPRYARKEMS